MKIDFNFSEYTFAENSIDYLDTMKTHPHD